MTLQCLARRRVSSPITRAAAIAGLVLAIVASPACRREPRLSDEIYREAVVAFYTGLAALQTSQEVLARQNFEKVTTVAPGEPAAWANIGLLLLRQQELDPAAERLTRAESLAPDNADIQRLLGLAESRRGNLAEAIRHWRRALDLRPGDAKAAYALAMDLERQGTPEALTVAQRTLDDLARRTGNVVARVEFVRLSAKRHDGAAIERGLAALAPAAGTWPADIQERFRAVEQQASTDAAAAGRAIAFLKNVLMRLPEYRRWLAALSTPREEVGEPLDRFVVLKNPSPQPAEPDTALRFTTSPDDVLGKPAGWVGAVWLSNEGRPLLAGFDRTTLTVGGKAVWRSGRTTATPGDHRASPGRDAVLSADLDYDFKTDLVVGGPHGVAFLRQQPDGSFGDVTAATKLPAAVLAADAFGLWAADVDTDGDLDVVEALTGGPLRVLRNNGDGTFAGQEPFPGAANIRSFAWADLDGDGVPDAAALDARGSLKLFVNARGGSFRAAAIPATFPKTVAIAIAEVTGDSIMDVIALTASGAVKSLSLGADGTSWVAGDVGTAGPGVAAASPGGVGLLTADVDNNGSIDIIAATPSGSQVLLRGAAANGSPRSAVAMDVRAAADLDDDGRLELVGVVGDGRAATARGTGQKTYGWQVLRPHAATVTGDQRINSFGIGGEVEVRTGLHVQKQLITSPAVHVGLGQARTSEVVRILWPNGTLQSEFNLAANASIAATQRLKGSCPWLFAWNGREMAFVTDVLWRSPLGLRINAQQTANVLMTEDWVKVAGDQLQARDGAYDLRITAELWETHFFDLASLLVVDHPSGTEVFVDERFAVPAPTLGVTVTGPVQPFASARDDRGSDLADVVRDRDDRHADFAGRGAYQGVTREHYLELDLPADAPRTGPLWLVAQGWVHPTDSSINVALGQGSHGRPRGIRLAVADRGGRYRVVRELGFPAGKDKTILTDLAGLFPHETPVGQTSVRHQTPVAQDSVRHETAVGQDFSPVPSMPRRIRLSTNMEIYWDRLGWAVGRPDVRVEPRRLVPASAQLRYRGYSRTAQSSPSSPERPRYVLEGTMPRWRDLEGYHTRFGDVRDLLLAVDDRYVIMNAGDELQLRFPEAAPPAAGHVRDYVMITDGWEKDGDFNTTFSRTVLPLPTHASGRYDTAPGRLEDDPVYRRHAADFEEYHTRYVTPSGVRDALRHTDTVGQ